MAIVFTWGQRLTIRIIAWTLRLRPGAAPQLREALDRGFRHRSESDRIAMWQAALARNGVRI